MALISPKILRAYLISLAFNKLIVDSNKVVIAMCKVSFPALFIKLKLAIICELTWNIIDVLRIFVTFWNADEATSALDAKLSLQIHQTLLDNPKVAVIEVEHKISDQEKSMFDRIIKLKR